MFECRKYLPPIPYDDNDPPAAPPAAPPSDNTPTSQDNDISNDDLLFNWQSGLGSPDQDGAGDAKGEPVPPTPPAPSSSMEERVQEYLKGVEVPVFEPTDEQRVAMQNGDFSVLNEYNVNAHRQMHMQNLQVVNKLVNSALEAAKKDFIAQANVNNTATDVMSSIKSCLLYTSPSPRDRQKSRMPSSA